MVPLERFVVDLSEIGLDDLRQAGGKGANLGHLIRAGYPVPPGFCALARAYEAVMDDPDLKSRILSVLESIDFSDSGAVEEGSARIREHIISTPIPASIADEIAAAYRGLAAEVGDDLLVAVRSSVATKDLRTTSFPGQMDTYHNLKGEEAVLEKVRECWASAFSYEATVNRNARGIDHFDVFVAPVVQLMVDAECAGVIFTANPLDHRRDRMVINSCFGLGEGVVSGLIGCDHFVVDGDSGVVLEERLGGQEFKIILDPKWGHGNIKMPLTPEERDHPSLTMNQIAELVETARSVEDGYGTPQDIEWAFSAGKLFVLQSRRIKGLDLGESREEEPVKEEEPEEWVCEFDSIIDPQYDEYTLSNISEVLPGVLTPLSISDLDSLDYGFIKANADLGLLKHIVPRGSLTFLGIFYGRCHLNLSVVKAMVSQLPGANIKDFDRREVEDNGGQREELWRPTPRNLIILPGILARLAYNSAKTPARAAALGREYEELLAEARETDAEEAPFQEIFDAIDGSRAKLYQAMAMHITISQLAVTSFDFLCRITALWLGDETGMLAARLVTGLHDIESAAPSDHIWDLSRMVKDSGRLGEIFADNENEAIMDRLREDPSPDAARFLAKLTTFLEDYGYRGINEAEAMIPTWDEDPRYLFATIKNCLDVPPEHSPRDIAARQEKERETAVEEAMGQLKEAQRRLLSYLMRQAQTYISLREYMKSILIKGLTHAKKVYRVISRRLVEGGVLHQPDDIYFLTNMEIKKLATGRSEDIPVEELVSRRRGEYERNLTVVLPQYSRGRPVPLTPGELEPQTDVEVLTGIGVSPGTVTGKARVITDPRRDAEIKPGEILVAPVTDAAWSPLFVTAAATVVDVGGPLSHGSIVAREFGIPCVVNVTSATRIIRTGQVISVDGGRGKVYLHPAEK